ncbi:YheC/YheD family protein [Heyndrickxia sporothermodurans]|uniref:YheC/YheD family endospore coat-associated protein n=1 Tax=Heyndrickxia sporothermodurans TaxID=46224 RepID=UPI002E24D351|nr:YheC/YheD family protein [Heyndrickxia sporothermodurans]
MNIYFDKKRGVFFHNKKANSPLFWGMFDELLPLSAEKTDSSLVKINVKKNGCRIGPLVGILTSKTKDGDVIGSKDVFISIQKQLQLCGGLSFIYTMEDCNEQFIDGTFFVEEENSWFKASFPYPNIIYNRLSARSDEKSEQFINHTNKLNHHQIFFFNPSFIDKYSMYQLFSKNPLLHPLLPSTRLIKEKEDLLEFLEAYSIIYLKPTIRSQGKGIFHIKREEDATFICKNAKKTYTFSSFIELWSFIEKAIQKNSYIAQVDIESAKISENKYDYRILSHYVNDEYQLTGVGIRVAEAGKITTHLSKGRSIFPYEKVKKKSLEKVFHWIIQECGKTLSKEYGNFAEFTIDMGRDQSGKLWIYEVNSKPMSFDEEDIEKKRIKNLIQIFYNQTIFN